MKIDEFLFSLGFGVRFSIPQFPIRLYLAKGFQYQPNAQSRRSRCNGRRETLAIGGLSFSFVISLGGNVF